MTKWSHCKDRKIWKSNVLIARVVQNKHLVCISILLTTVELEKYVIANFQIFEILVNFEAQVGLQVQDREIVIDQIMFFC